MGPIINTALALAPHIRAIQTKLQPIAREKAQKMGKLFLSTPRSQKQGSLKDTGYALGIAIAPSILLSTYLLKNPQHPCSNLSNLHLID